MNNEQLIADIQVLKTQYEDTYKKLITNQETILNEFSKRPFLQEFVDWYNKDYTREVRLRYKCTSKQLDCEFSLENMARGFTHYERTKIIKTELLDKIEDFYNQFLIEYKEQLQNQLKDWRE